MESSSKVRSRPPVVAVSGLKNSGKTTLLSHLIPLLRARGLRVAALKHDGHDFSPDVPGTDSYRLSRAGAQAVGVFSAHRFFLSAEEKVTVEDLIDMCGPVDLVLLEGGKASPYPKIELVRAAVSQAPVCDINTLLALCTDTSLHLPGVPSVGLDGYPELADIIISHLNLRSRVPQPGP